jgi:hypothetical protein
VRLATLLAVSLGAAGCGGTASSEGFGQLGATLRISSGSIPAVAPSLAAGGGGWALGWEQSIPNIVSEVVLAWLDGEGQPMGQPTHLAHAAGVRVRADAAGHFGVSYRITDETGAGGQLWFATMDVAGVVGRPKQVTAFPQASAGPAHDMVLVGGRWAAASCYRQADGTGHLALTWFDADGSNATSRELSGEPCRADRDLIALRADAGGLWLAFVADVPDENGAPAVWLRRMTGDGDPIGQGETRVSPVGAGGALLVGLATHDSLAAVVYWKQGSDALAMGWFEGSGVPYGPERMLDTTGANGAADAIAGGPGYEVTWFTVPPGGDFTLLSRGFGSNGGAATKPAAVRGLGNVLGPPSIDHLAAGDLGIAFSDGDNVEPHAVYFGRVAGL